MGSAVLIIVRCHISQAAFPGLDLGLQGGGNRGWEGTGLKKTTGVEGAKIKRYWGCLQIATAKIKWLMLPHIPYISMYVSAQTWTHNPDGCKQQEMSMVWSAGVVYSWVNSILCLCVRDCVGIAKPRFAQQKNWKSFQGSCKHYCCITTSNMQ